MEILFMQNKMLNEVINSESNEGDLDISGIGITGMNFKPIANFLFSKYRVCKKFLHSLRSRSLVKTQ
jgi:hypothetical protein